MSLSIRSITIALKPVFITNYSLSMGITMLIELMQGSIWMSRANSLISYACSIYLILQDYMCYIAYLELLFLIDMM